MVGGNEQLDRPRLARGSADETKALKLEDHLVNTGRGDTEEALEIGLGRWLAVEEDIGVNKGQVLALFVREWRSGLGGHGSYEVIQRLDESTVPHHIVAG